jgi:anti-sigma factor RsiW
MNEQELAALLPWYANGTLGEDEKHAVENWLAESRDARAQLAFIQTLARDVQSAPAAQASDLGWQRLKRELKNQRGSETPKAGKTAGSWWRPGLAAAAAVVIALQIGILVQPQKEAANQHLLSGNPTALANHWLIQVEFRDETAWQSLSKLLLDLDARLIDGPSSIGLVRIAVPAGEGRFSSPDQLLDYLANQNTVVHAALESE